jgi:hypothetical protein
MSSISSKFDLLDYQDVDSQEVDYREANRQETDDECFCALPEVEISGRIRGIENYTTTEEGKVIEIAKYREILGLRKQLDKLKLDFLRNGFDELCAVHIANAIEKTRQGLIDLGVDVEPIDYNKL